MKYKGYLALGLLTVVILWMLSGAMESSPETSEVMQATQTSAQKVRVKVMDIEARQVTREIVIQGELEALRQVEIKSQIDSKVVALPVEKGNLVKQGDLLIKLDKEDRYALLNRAKAAVKSSQLEAEGVRRLQKQDLRSQTHLKAAEATLSDAQAVLQRAQLEIEYLSVKAPFSGVLEARYVELGSRVQNGDTLALVVDKSIIKSVGEVSQKSAGQLALGQSIKLMLLDGREAQGKLTYISSVGDSETHSFRVEAEVDNSDGKFSPGVSATIRIDVGHELAHFLSPAVLSLNGQGEVGVKTVDENNVVQFFPIQLLRTEESGVWVTGLPQKVRVITLGQGFVSAGETVIPAIES